MGTSSISSASWQRRQLGGCFAKRMMVLPPIRNAMAMGDMMNTSAAMMGVRTAMTAVPAHHPTLSRFQIGCARSTSTDFLQRGQ